MTNYITSYKNPDTDGVACMLGAAALLGADWVPVMTGELNDETTWVLAHLNLSAPRMAADFDDAEKIILVDTHFAPQLPSGLPPDKIVKIIDHHPGGDFTIFPNALDIHNRCGGAAASIVAHQALYAGITDQKILKLLAFAIQSNSNGLKSVSTNDFDRSAFAGLAAQAPIDDNEIADMFRARARVLELGAYDVMMSDYKEFDTASGRFGISQIEQFELFKWLETVRIESALQKLATDKNLNFCAVNCADIALARSRVFAANKQSADALRRATGEPFDNLRQDFSEMVLRKNLIKNL